MRTILRDALVVDAQGNPIRQHQRVTSRDWGEIEQWTNSVYMPLHVAPIGRLTRPRARMYSAMVGRITVTRFAWGIPVNVRAEGSADIFVMTTIRGHRRHCMKNDDEIVSGVGESFIVDCGYADINVDIDGANLQINMTIPHHVMAQICHDWFGFVPNSVL